MERKCPKCGSAVQLYHQFCPVCDEDLPPDPGEAKSDQDIPVRSEEKSYVGYRESVPDNPEFYHKASPVSASGDNPSPPMALAGLHDETCPHCGKEVPHDFQICGHCGKPLSEMKGAPGSPFSSVAEAGRSVVPYYARAAPAPVQEFSPAAGNVESPIPICAYFNAGKKYLEQVSDIFEMVVSNTFPGPIETLKVGLRCRLSRDTLQEQVPFSLLPGVRHPLPLSGFFPTRPGKDVIHISFKGAMAGGQRFHLLGSVPIEVAPRQEKPANVSVNISAQGPVIGDVEVAIPGTGQSEMGLSGAPVDRWVPLQLFWDREEQERELRYFPAACIKRSECLSHQGVEIAAMQLISPEDAPLAALTTENNIVYQVVAGTTFFLGRGEQINHVCTILYPEEPYRQRNKKVSRQHCRISIHGRDVFISDLSGNGTWINKNRLPRNMNRPLADGDRIGIAGLLELTAGILTDGEEVQWVLLTRSHNKTNVRYILAGAPIAIGAREGLPVSLPGLPDIWGFLYHHTGRREWHFCPAGVQPGSPQDMPLGSFQELVSGNTKLFFSVVR